MCFFIVQDILFLTIQATLSKYSQIQSLQCFHKLIVSGRKYNSFIIRLFLTYLQPTQKYSRLWSWLIHDEVLDYLDCSRRPALLLKHVVKLYPKLIFWIIWAWQSNKYNIFTIFSCLDRSSLPGGCSVKVANKLAKLRTSIFIYVKTEAATRGVL